MKKMNRYENIGYDNMQTNSSGIYLQTSWSHQSLMINDKYDADFTWVWKADELDCLIPFRL